MFEIRFRTTRFAPPHAVSILTHLNDWENIEGVYADGSWTFALDETGVWRAPGYFKFVLDERFWMDDPYVRLAPTAGAAYDFDEATVTFTMDTPPQPLTPPAPGPTPTPTPDPAPAPVAPPDVPISEGSVINRVVILMTPLLTAGAAWIAGVIARHVPGVKLDQTQVVSFMIAIVAICLASVWKWLQGWQQHELLVAQKLAAPIKPVLGNLPLKR